MKSNPWIIKVPTRVILLKWASSEEIVIINKTLINRSYMKITKITMITMTPIKRKKIIGIITFIMKKIKIILLIIFPARIITQIKEIILI